MNRWKKELNLQDVWWYRNGECGPETWTNKTVHELGKIIARKIKAKFHKELEEDMDLEEIHFWMSTISTEKEYKTALEEHNTFFGRDGSEVIPEPLEEFNSVMAEFYDWADTHRVWINK